MRLRGHRPCTRSSKPNKHSRATIRQTYVKPRTRIARRRRPVNFRNHKHKRQSIAKNMHTRFREQNEQKTSTNNDSATDEKGIQKETSEQNIVNITTGSIIESQPKYSETFGINRYVSDFPDSDCFIGTFSTEFSVKLNGEEMRHTDKKTPRITCMAVFPSGEIIMCDINNNSVKLVKCDGSTYSIAAWLETSGSPRAVAVSGVDPLQAYVAVSENKQQSHIYRVSIKDGKIRFVDFVVFWTDRVEYGMTCSDKYLIFARYLPQPIAGETKLEIELRNYHGDREKTIYPNISPSVCCYLSLNVDSTGTRLNISGLEACFTCSIDITGEKKTEYNGIFTQRETPDKADNIYMTPDNYSLGQFLNCYVERFSRLRAIAYLRINSDPHILFSSIGNDCLRLYRLRVCEFGMIHANISNNNAVLQMVGARKPNQYVSRVWNATRTRSLLPAFKRRKY